MRIFLLAALIGLSWTSDSQYDGVATFEPCAAISFSGTIKFTFTSSAKSIFVDVSLPANTDYKVKIHEYLADYGADSACGLTGETWDPTDKKLAVCDTAVDISKCVQGNLNSMYGKLSAMNKGAATALTADWKIGNTDQVVGRSVALYDDNDDIVTCVPILPSGSSATTYYRSKLTTSNGVYGQVTLIRAALSTGAYMMFGNSLLGRSGGNELYSVQVGTQAMTKQGSCSGGNYMDLSHIGYVVNGDDVKEYDAVVSSSNAMLTSTGTAPTSVQIRDWKNTVSGNQNYARTCGPVYEIKAKSAYAWLYQDGVNSKVSFSQASPFDPVTVTFSDTTFTAATKFWISGYSVPVYQNKYQSCSDTCSMLWSHKQEDSATDVDVGTAALSSTGYSTRKITLYGQNSIIGRGAVILNGTTSFCGNVQNDKEVIRRVADFHGLLGGELVLEQDAANPWDDVTVLNSLYAYNDDDNVNVELFLNNNANDEAKTGTSRCASTLSVYYGDSGSISTGDAACADKNFPYNCKQGVTKSRIGVLDIQTVENSVQYTQVLTDPYMSLSGGYNVPNYLYIKRGASPAVYDCANLKDVGDFKATAAVVRYADATATSTKYSFYNTELTVDFQYKDESGKTVLNVNANPILSLTKIMGINEKPVPTSYSGYPYLACGADAVGKLVNWNMGMMKGSGSGVSNGDLSGQYGFLNAQSTVISKSNLRLKHYNFFNKALSPLYRSLRLGYGVDNDDYVCANVVPKLNAGTQTETTLYAVFYGSSQYVSGQIQFKQVAISTGSGSYLLPTNIQSYLTHRNHTDWTTDTHRIYVTKYGSCSEFASGFKIEDDVYNPYNVDKEQFTNNEEFPHFSQVGDISAKSGVQAALGKRDFYNVNNLPLSGTFSISGKAVIVTDSLTRGYLGCATVSATQTNSGVSLTVGLTTLLSSLLYFLLQ